jgi:REP element-mobilizing transposase RayT
VHVTLKARPDVGRLRRGPAAVALRQALGAGCEKPSFRLCHFSIQPDHVHLICEADDEVALSRGVAGLEIRMARAINRLLTRRGRVWADRYHATILRTPRQTRFCLVYVLGNFRHHGGERTSPKCIDVWSSSYWFVGYRERAEIPEPPVDPPPVVAPRSWLLSEGWTRAGGLISVTEGPKS